MLTAGYLEDWTWNATLSGAPQGGVGSPILSNIYLHRLDIFVETGADPGIHPRRTPGTATRPTGRWTRDLAKARRRGDRAAVRALRQAAAQPAQPGS